MTLSGIYKITNLKYNKIYIGESKDIFTRWQYHIEQAFQPKSASYNYPLQRAIRQDGINNFSFEILEVGLYDTLIRRDKEREYIEIYDSYRNGYNQNSGHDIYKDVNKKKRMWTEEEIEILKKLILEKIPYKEIGERLNRSEKSITTKAARLHLGPRTNNPWTREKEATMLSLRNQGYTQLEVSKILGFSKEAVKKRWHDVFKNTEGVWNNVNK